MSAGSPCLLGITYDPERHDELMAAADIDVLEIKHLELAEPLAREARERFKDVSLHVQYVAPDGEPLTLNLANPRIASNLRDPDCIVYRAAAALKPSWISFHCGFASEEIGVEGTDRHNVARGPILSFDETLRRLAAALTTATGQIAKILAGRDWTLLVENLDHQSSAYDHVVEPRFIKGLCQQTDARLLLDTAHVGITAHNLGYPDPRAYLRGLEGVPVAEVHLCAPTIDAAGLWTDDLQPFTAMERAQMLESVLRLPPRAAGAPLLITFECTRRLPEQIARVRALIGGARDA